MNPELPLVVAYGGGINSTAMLCGFRERGIKPDLILFADTKGENDHTYQHVVEMSALCQLWWGIEIQTVRKLYQGRHEGLEENCLRKSMLPSLAYGRKACSMKYKVEPQDRAVKKWMDAHGVKRAIRAIGYHAGEGHRAVGKKEDDLRKGRTAEFWYPLIEWQWRQQECMDAITRHGISPPGKSACFFCPATKRGEIIRMAKEEPELYARALAIEENAISITPGRGLGGSNLKWADVMKAEAAAGADLWDWLDQHSPTPIPCGCFDV